MKKALIVLAFLLAIPVLLANKAYAATNHTVQKGETLWGISQTNGITLYELRKANNKWDDLILIGQNIIIPAKGESVSKPTVKNTKQSKQTTSSEVKAPSSDRDLLARLVRAEAESEPYAGKVEVAKVVLNRVNNDQFPNSIQGVIYESGQFSPVSNGSIYKSADSESVRAVNEAFNIGGNGQGSLYFYNPSTATSRWLDNRPTVTVIGHHVFKR
ncbi:hypothetical protein Goe21_00210 [Bacillus phage vB_BsuM-Goe21]|nr:N-acetylmuramoyl-L-alanine amidase [Bacillus subtilis]WCS68131.1 hypothetical protein Goe21_00210 [Bacillus phage vB_BsuM-Goe21]